MNPGRRKGRAIGAYYAPNKAENWLYGERRAAGLTIDALAEKSGVSARTIKRIESGSLRAGYRSSEKLQKCLADMRGTICDRKS